MSVALHEDNLQEAAHQAQQGLAEQSEDLWVTQFVQNIDQSKREDVVFVSTSYANDHCYDVLEMALGTEVFEEWKSKLAVSHNTPRVVDYVTADLNSILSALEEKRNEAGGTSASLLENLSDAVGGIQRWQLLLTRFKTSEADILEADKPAGLDSRDKKTRNHFGQVRGRAAQRKLVEKVFQRAIKEFYQLYGRLPAGEFEFTMVVRSVAVNNGTSLLTCESPMLEGVLGKEFYKASTTTMACYWQNLARHERDEEEAAAGNPIPIEDLPSSDQLIICSAMHECIVLYARKHEKVTAVIRFSEGMTGQLKLGRSRYWPLSQAFEACLACNAGNSATTSDQDFDSEGQRLPGSGAAAQSSHDDSGEPCVPVQWKDGPHDTRGDPPVPLNGMLSLRHNGIMTIYNAMLPHPAIDWDKIFWAKSKLLTSKGHHFLAMKKTEQSAANAVSNTSDALHVPLVPATVTAQEPSTTPPEDKPARAPVTQVELDAARIYLLEIESGASFATEEYKRWIGDPGNKAQKTMKSVPDEMQVGHTGNSDLSFSIDIPQAPDMAFRRNRLKSTGQGISLLNTVNAVIAVVGLPGPTALKGQNKEAVRVRVLDEASWDPLRAKIFEADKEHESSVDLRTALQSDEAIEKKEAETALGMYRKVVASRYTGNALMKSLASSGLYTVLLDAARGAVDLKPLMADHSKLVAFDRHRYGVIDARTPSNDLLRILRAVVIPDGLMLATDVLDINTSAAAISACCEAGLIQASKMWAQPDWKLFLYHLTCMSSGLFPSCLRPWQSLFAPTVVVADGPVMSSSSLSAATCMPPATTSEGGAGGDQHGSSNDRVPETTSASHSGHDAAGAHADLFCDVPVAHLRAQVLAPDQAKEYIAEVQGLSNAWVQADKPRFDLDRLTDEDLDILDTILPDVPTMLATTSMDPRIRSAKAKRSKASRGEQAAADPVEKTSSRKAAIRKGSRGKARGPGIAVPDDSLFDEDHTGASGSACLSPSPLPQWGIRGARTKKRSIQERSPAKQSTTVPCQRSRIQGITPDGNDVAEESGDLREKGDGSA